VVDELVALGGAVPAGDVSLPPPAERLPPAEFHSIAAAGRDDVVLVDCRNFYESRVGKFDGAVAPDIRKVGGTFFSGW